MLLVVDVGNTNTVFGLYHGQKLRRTWRVLSMPRAVLSLAARLPRNLTALVVSSVVPKINDNLRVLAKRCGISKVTFVSSKTPLPIRIKVPHPEKVGVDRIVNAVAAYEKYRSPLTAHRSKLTLCGSQSQPRASSLEPVLLIIDFGTATTFDVVTSRGEFIGGAIAPGLKTVSEALSSRCAQLPRIPLKKPRRTIGRTTIEAMQSGVFLGYVAMVEGMIERFRKELGVSLLVIATGGLSSLLKKHVRGIDRVDPSLTLEGLKLIAGQVPS